MPEPTHLPGPSGPDEPPRPSAFKDWLSRYLPITCLVTVALLQTGLVLTYDLSRWKGGGFGMFSTADTPFSRFLRIRVVVAGEAHAVAVPASLRELAQRARVMPTQERLDEVARLLSEGRWIRDESSLLDPEARTLIRERLFSADEDQLDSAVEEIERICRGSVIKMRNAPTLRMLLPDEPMPASAVRVQPEEVVVELWRYRFEDPARRLKAWKARSAHLRTEARPVSASPRP